MLKLAKGVSYIFHPIFYFFYIYLIYWLFNPYANRSVAPAGLAIAFGIVFFNTALLPVILILASKRSLLSGSLSDRRLSILLTAVIYAVTYFTFAKSILPRPIQHILWATVAGLALGYLANHFIKLSLHASGAGGLVAVFLFHYLDYGGIYFWILIVALLVAGLVGTSRLILGAHTNKELYLGYASGFVATFGALVWYS